MQQKMEIKSFSIISLMGVNAECAYLGGDPGEGYVACGEKFTQYMITKRERAS